MFFKVHILYIDEARPVYKVSDEEAEKRKNFIIEICKKYGFSYSVLKLESVMEIEELPTSMAPTNQEERKEIENAKIQDEENHSAPFNPEEFMDKEVECLKIEESSDKLEKLIELLPTTMSFREELIFYLKKWIILNFALKYNFKKVLLGIAGHQISTRMISELARGRGASIS
jgi:hypothetical protein